jgi:hypothetical protein
MAGVGTAVVVVLHIHLGMIPDIRTCLCSVVRREKRRNMCVCVREREGERGEEVVVLSARAPESTWK